MDELHVRREEGGGKRGRWTRGHVRVGIASLDFSRAGHERRLRPMPIRPFQKLLCANRGEIAIRVFRACSELGIRTVAIFSEEDATNQHRYKADESYLVGKGKAPVAAYLGGDEIIEVARRAQVDAIHPGYGFLSENHKFAAAVRAAGIAFVGPSAHALQYLGDKVEARKAAEKLRIPTVPGIELPADEAAAFAAAEAFFRENGTT